MINHILRITERGSQVTQLEYLGGLTGYSLKEIESLLYIPQGGENRIMIFERNPKDKIRVGMDIYVNLEKAYQNSSISNSEVDSLIESVDSFLDEQGISKRRH